MDNTNINDMFTYRDYEKYLPNHLFYTKEELVDIIPDLDLFFKDSLIMKDRTLFLTYKDNINLLLKDILVNEGMRKYLVSQLDIDKEIAITIHLVENNSKVDTIKMTKRELAKVYQEMLGASLSSDENQSIVFFLCLLDDVACENRYHDYSHSCYIDNDTYKLEVYKLLNYIFNNKQFEDLKHGRDIPKYSKEIVAYMIVDFCEKEGIFDKYLLDDDVYDRYKDLKSMQSIDYEYLNKFNKTDDIDIDGNTLLDTFNISQDLKRYVYEGMKKDYSPLEKAIHIYIKLCEVLTYDDAFYASGSNYEQGSRAHRDIKTIALIGEDDNKVVSYEFMLIYAKLLKELKIKYSLNLNSMRGVSETKSSISFAWAEFLVNVDLFEESIRNDLANVKIGNPLTGIRSINTNLETHKKFEDLIYSIYVENRNTIERTKQFNEALKVYKEKYQKDSVSKRDKLFGFLKLSGSKDLKGMDSINYILTIFNNIFYDDEDIRIDILTKQVNMVSRPIILISLEEYNDSTYILIDPNNDNRYEEIGQNQLSAKLRDKKLTYFVPSNVEKEKYAHVRKA